jgi:hypothetical protein
MFEISGQRLYVRRKVPEVSVNLDNSGVEKNEGNRQQKDDDLGILEIVGTRANSIAGRRTQENLVLWLKHNRN